jgi:hypothetical protein
MLGQLRRGSAADAPLGLLSALNEMVRGTPDDSALTMKGVETSTSYRDLWSAKVRAGEPAPDFELPKVDLQNGTERPTGETVRLSSYRQVSPVALIFGSYT